MKSDLGLISVTFIEGTSSECEAKIVTVFFVDVEVSLLCIGDGNVTLVMLSSTHSTR